MFERREEGLRALTAGRRRPGRPGRLTHIRPPLELRAGPGLLRNTRLWPPAAPAPHAARRPTPFRVKMKFESRRLAG